MFSPLLQGDLPRVLPSALHQTAALCASWRRVLGLFCAFLRYTLLSYPLPCGLSRILLPILCAWNILALAEGPGGPVRRPCGFTRTHLNNGRAGEDARPYENTGSCPVNAAGGRSQTGLPSSFNHKPHENSWESGFEFYANKRHLKPSCFRCQRFLCRMDGAILKTHHI